jgi:hypothetical protein
VSGAWNGFWFRVEPRANFVAARMIVALTSLWLVLSRPELPKLLSWPDPFWLHPNGWLRARFLIGGLPYAIENALYVVLMVALLLTAIGRFTAASAFTAAVLLYHFAAFEDVISSSSGPFFRGFTACISCLFVIAFSQHPNDDSRWPLALMRLLVAFTYLLSGISKMRLVGWRWATAANFEGIVAAMVLPDVRPPWAHWFLGHPLLCWLGALTGAAMDLLFISAVFSKRAARVVVPLTFIAHVVVVKVLGVVYLAAPLLLLFVNWQWLSDVWRARRGAGATTPARELPQ